MRFFASVLLPAVLVLLFASPLAQARDNFITSQTTPYPPGCISSNNLGIATPTGGRRVYADDNVSLSSVGGGSDAIVSLTIFRRGCIDPNRSVLFVTIEQFSAASLVAVPRVFIEAGGTRYPMRLVTEANTFDTNRSGTVLGTGTFNFIVDGVAENAIAPGTPILTPTQYDGAITLIVQDANRTSTEYAIPLAAWNAQIVPIKYPLNGRLSGVWVSEGADRQGFVLSFSENVRSATISQLLFFSWYTYGADGSPLWLASSETFQINDSSVELPLELLTNGEFLGEAEPDSQGLASATLTAESCSELTLEYDLQALGLGTGTVTLVRSFDLETAGYACNDLEARLGGN